ncbi:MAG: magnesium/cobalt transporter CorA [Pirellulales bacterium]
MARHGKKHRRNGKHLHRRTQPGALPGEIVADPHSKRPRMTVMAYGPTAVVERTLAHPHDLRELRDRYPVLWLNVDGLGDAQTIEQIGDAFGLHRLALEDAVNTHQRAKLDIYDDFLFIVARMAEPRDRSYTEQLALFLGSNFVITIQEEEGDCWDTLRKRIQQGIGRIRQSGPDFLAYSLLDAVIDDYFPLLEACGDELDQIEESVVSTPTKESLDALHRVKGELLGLRRAIWPHREMLASLARESTPFVTDGARVYLRDCYDHVIQITELLETYRELTADLRDLYMSAVSNRINETMRVLTIIATIFIPITFIASIYGMNFDGAASPWNMPELHWAFGYPTALSLMLLTAVGMWWHFRRRGWLVPVDQLLEVQKRDEE